MADSTELPESLRDVRSLTFDLMGTCLDWLTNVQARLEAAPPFPEPAATVDMRELAMKWRQGFFDEIMRAWRAREEVPDKDVVHVMVLQRLLRELGAEGAWREDVVRDLLAAWHTQYGAYRLPLSISCRWRSCSHQLTDSLAGHKGRRGSTQRTL
jgi:hypothetical protein